ncbi:hypothetical protein [Tenacibaculum sp. 190524A02b]|uniref:HEXXH motif-containing protein n=1 Tax=Tenacibaculum vairaonense TaxID=3137860 RepID=A0ABP1FC37_9FLAO
MLLTEQNINIELAEKALLFSINEAQEINSLIINEFYDLVDTRLVKLLEKYPDVNQSYKELSIEEQKKIKKAPEVLSLLFASDNSLINKNISYFLLRLFEAERAKKTETFNVEKFGESLWSADGSFMISYDTEDKTFATFEHPTVSNTQIPQDFFSHFNLINSTDKNHYSSEELKPILYSFEEADLVSDKITRVFDKLDDCFKKFICTYTNVLMLKKTIDENMFTSGTDSTHINRVIITNAHTVEDEVIADAMIHEAIHGTLTIIDVFNEWQPSRKKSLEFGRNIYSPWTNNLLTIRNLVQAVYVWYGLYNFWSTRPANFNQDYIEKRIVYIENGFKKMNITPYKEIINPTTYKELSSIKNKFL